MKNGAWATISSARGEIEARVLVTERLRPLRMGRRWIHQIGLPYHWGDTGLVKGDSVNELLALGSDANVSIMESKAITGNIRSGRRDRSAPKSFSTDFAPGDNLRDSPQTGSLPVGKNNVHAPKAKQGDQT